MTIDNPLYKVLVGLCVPALMLGLVGCSSGSSDDEDDDGGDSDGGSLRTDACDVLGLKIINGATCSTTESPVVNFDVYYTTGGSSSCSGTMISNRDVLTAHHCFIDNGRNIFAISVNADARVIPAESYALHPGYAEVSVDIPGGVAFFNDVAVVRLSETVTLPSMPLYLSRGLQKNDIISIFGYGLDENGSAGRLESGEMLVDSVPGNHLIAIYNGDGSNTCQGDSGGPAIYSSGATAGIVGLTSSGDPSTNCLEGDTSLFANVQDPSILNFIRQLVPNVGSI